MTQGSESSGRHLPAITDWPRGYGESSWWPITLVVGVAALYGGLALFFVGRGVAGVGWLPGAVLAVAGVGLFVVGAGGWLVQAFVDRYWDRAGGDGGWPLKLGMLVFLASDVATFGAGFTYYIFIRLGLAWPPSHLPQGLLSVVLAVNTLALLVSSGTFVWGERRLRVGDRRGFLLGVGLTVLLGAVFVVGQAIEYDGFITSEGFTLQSGLFASAFYPLTALHGLHVILGVVLLSTVLVRGFRGQFDAEHHVSVTTVGWYWHFVDGVWLFLVALIYVGSQVAIPGLTR